MSQPDCADQEPPPSMPPALDPLRRPPSDRYCDLVLKGGVVDGVIYPGTLIELARHYRFQSIAGTSVGAIAGSLAAASEYARRFGSDDGFNEVLRKIPDDLAKPPDPNSKLTDPDPDSKVTKLRTLFQPDKHLARLFNLFVDLASRKSGQGNRRLFLTIWSHYKKVFQLGAIVGLALTSSVSLLLSDIIVCMYKACNAHSLETPLWTAFAGLIHVHPIALLSAGLLSAILFGLSAVARKLWVECHDLAATPGFGFCGGLSVDGCSDEGLTDWLHKGIQGAAKLPLGRPLTFRDLWEAPDGPKNFEGQSSPKSIDLRMISTAVSHGRPYEFPQEDPSVRLFFKLSEFELYFPSSILEYLKRNARTYDTIEKYYAIEIDGEVGPNLLNSPHPEDQNKCDFRELPVGELPVLVAVRLSMNFPLLFKAVPLWAIDYEAGRPATIPRIEAPRFRKVWFTDGGATSNFPIHIFDKPVPAWPTFGINLAEESRENFYDQIPPSLYKTRLSVLSDFHTTNRNEKWQLGEDDPEYKAKHSVASTGFLKYLMNLGQTSKDWADNANLRMPGIRDRVVTVYKNKLTNGGLNLKLQPDQILSLGYVNGVEAGKKLVAKFLTDPARMNTNLDGTPGWLDHRWVRFNSYLCALKGHLAGFSDSINNSGDASSVVQQIEEAKRRPPLKYLKYFEPILSDVQAVALKKAIEAIQTLEASLAADPVVQPYAPRPQTELKARARI